MNESKKPEQNKIWEGDFGNEYTDRNPHFVEELDALYKNDYGITRRGMNEEFLENLDLSTRILEVGANAGVQLGLLLKMGFRDVCGIEPNDYAIRLAKKNYPEIEIKKGSAFSLPFNDGDFDFVFTSGVLIHIAPSNLLKAAEEIYRATNRYIWGFEYYSPTLAEVKYRGLNNLLWKQDFASFYLRNFPGLKILKEKKFTLVNSSNISQMFLMEKRK